MRDQRGLWDDDVSRAMQVEGGETGQRLGVVMASKESGKVDGVRNMSSGRRYGEAARS